MIHSWKIFISLSQWELIKYLYLFVFVFYLYLYLYLYLCFFNFVSRLKRGVPDDHKIWSATAIVNVDFNLEQIKQYTSISGKIARDCVDIYNNNNDNDGKNKKTSVGFIGPIIRKL